MNRSGLVPAVLLLLLSAACAPGDMEEYLAERRTEPTCEELLDMGEDLLERGCCTRAAHAFEKAREAGCAAEASAGLSLSLWCRGQNDEALSLLRGDLAADDADGLSGLVAALELMDGGQRRRPPPQVEQGGLRLDSVLLVQVKNISASPLAWKYEPVLAHLTRTALSGAGLETLGSAATGRPSGGLLAWFDEQAAAGIAAESGAEYAAILEIHAVAADTKEDQAELSALGMLAPRLLLIPSLPPEQRRAVLERKVREVSNELTRSSEALLEAELRVRICERGLEYFQRRREMDVLVARRDALQDEARRLMNTGRIAESKKVLEEIEEIEERISSLFNTTRSFIKHRLELELGVFDADPEFLRSELARQEEIRDKALREIPALERRIRDLRERSARTNFGPVYAELPRLCSPLSFWPDRASLALKRVLPGRDEEAGERLAEGLCSSDLLPSDRRLLSLMERGFSALAARDFQEAAGLFRRAGPLAPELIPPPEHLGVAAAQDLPRPEAAHAIYEGFLAGPDGGGDE